MDGITWNWVLILLLLVCPISMLLMRRAHRHMHGGQRMDGGRPHEHTENRKANIDAADDAAPGASRPLNELQRRQEALEREIEGAQGGRLVNDRNHKH